MRTVSAKLSRQGIVQAAICRIGAARGSYLARCCAESVRAIDFDLPGASLIGDSAEDVARPSCRHQEPRPPVSPRGSGGDVRLHTREAAVVLSPRFASWVWLATSAPMKTLRWHRCRCESGRLDGENIPQNCDLRMKCCASVRTSDAGRLADLCSWRCEKTRFPAATSERFAARRATQRGRFRKTLSPSAGLRPSVSPLQSKADQPPGQ